MRLPSHTRKNPPSMFATLTGRASDIGSALTNFSGPGWAAVATSHHRCRSGTKTSAAARVLSMSRFRVRFRCLGYGRDSCWERARASGPGTLCDSAFRRTKPHRLPLDGVLTLRLDRRWGTSAGWRAPMAYDAYSEWLAPVAQSCPAGCAWVSVDQPAEKPRTWLRNMLHSNGFRLHRASSRVRLEPR